MSIELRGCGVFQADPDTWLHAWSLARAFGYVDAPVNDRGNVTENTSACEPWLVEVARSEALAFGRALHRAIVARCCGTAMTFVQEEAWTRSRVNVGHLRELADFAVSGGFTID